MDLPSSETPLPPLVEETVQKICREQLLPSPDHIAPCTKLALLGQERSLKLLKEISSRKNSDGSPDLRRSSKSLLFAHETEPRWEAARQCVAPTTAVFFSF
ncbi:hypothetical protein MRB53_032056 [Persea americana]|uniref:Uncharacterized protein n=1 Tax=Persea americana TaxID=3435 RepID=A0ACC2KR58_PERAE|nr:hypothetical protein MRB53_032056 [Persea americana]